MATSFEPMVFGDAPKPAWLAALADDAGFTRDPRFQPHLAGTSSDSAQAAPDPAQDAYEAGFAEGEAAALAKQAEEQQHTEKLKLALSQVDGAVRNVLEKRLQHIVAGLCEATVAPHFIDTGRLQERCRKAAAMLEAVHADCSLTLHPGDIARLDPEFAAGWAILADETLERGTVRLFHGESELVDGPQQWREALAEAIGL